GPIELVPSDTGEVEVVSQTAGEVVAMGLGRNRQDGETGVQDEAPKELDVQLQRRGRGVHRRLTVGEEQADLSKQVVSDPPEGAGADPIAIVQRSPVGLNRRAAGVEGRDIAVEGPAQVGPLDVDWAFTL